MALTDLQIQTMGRDAMQAAADGDFAGAERLLSAIVEARPNGGQALSLLGQARLKLGRFADAREPLERGARFLPRDAAAQVNAAGCLMMLGAHADALFFLDRAGKLKPGDAAILYNRGRCLEALGQPDAAHAAYDEALAVDHRLAPALRDTLMLARGLDGVDAAVQAGAQAAAWLAVPTVARGAALDDFVATVPLRSLPFLLGWSPMALPPPPALQPGAAPADDRIGWFTTVPSPDGLAVERDPARAASCRAVVGDDVAATHHAAALGRPTLLLRSDADNLLLGLRNGPTSWYASFEVQDRDDTTALAGWLSRC